MAVGSYGMESGAQTRQTIETRCCIVGGGPAGMVLGFLLARAGVDVVVLEKHADFLRDFRGDTIHPSTLELMYELGLLERFLQRPHQELAQLGGVIDDHAVAIADFSHLPTHAKFIALMPQWEFLNFLAEEAKRFPAFHLHMQAEVVDLLEAQDRVVGVRAKTPEGLLEIRAHLTVGADGRHSTVRARAGLEVVDSGAPIDVLWMRVPREPGDPDQTLGRVKGGRILITLDRGDYWQCAYVIRKGGFAALEQRGIESFRADVASTAPSLLGRVDAIKGWDDVKLLTVAVDHLRRWWRPGLLSIGDSAHAMSPVGGVGINLAIQDAVAAANIMAQPLLHGSVTERELRRVQLRRAYPARMTQRFQVAIHKRLLTPVLGSQTPLKTLPLPFRLLQRFPYLRRIPARAIGIGLRPEHVRTEEMRGM